MGFEQKNPILHEPNGPNIVLPEAAYFEAKMRWNDTGGTPNLYVGGLMARAKGEITGGSRDYIQSLRFLIDPSSKAVILYEDNVFANWGGTTSGTDGTFDDFAYATDYIVRLNFSNIYFWGEIWGLCRVQMYA